MMIVLLPIGFGISAWLPTPLEVGGLLGSTAVIIALSSFFGQLARDQGKRREPELFRRWGGRPSDRALSYGAGAFAPATLARRHQALSQLDPGLRFPASAEEEQAAAGRYEPVYRAATDLLLARTRDRQAFALLFNENMNYGYRRNLWAMRPAGLLAAILGLASCATRVGSDLLAGLSPSTVALAGGAVCTVLLVLWSLRINSSWVKIPADAFARQLAEACDRLHVTP